MSNKIVYSKRDTLPDPINDQDVTVQISLKIEGDLLKALRARATSEGKPYQTLMKQMLRAQLGENQSDPEDVRKRLSDLETQVRKLTKGVRPLVRSSAKRKLKRAM